jgi:hypothetical protein
MRKNENVYEFCKILFNEIIIQLNFDIKSIDIHYHSHFRHFKHSYSSPDQNNRKRGAPKICKLIITDYYKTFAK